VSCTLPIVIQLNTVGPALSSGAIDLAVTVADDVPAGTHRRSLFTGGFTCLYDPRRGRIGKRISKQEYLERFHVVVSYNGDLRGIVEDLLHKQRRVRCSVSSFANLGAIVDGSDLLATVPGIVADHIRAVRPHLATKPLPFDLQGAAMELLWPAATDDDAACRFVRDQIVRLAGRARSSGRAASRA
jgi:LysR family transcriptional activator of mexEF-oprN operon